MVKLIGAVMTGAACGYFGFRASYDMKKRAESLSDIEVSLELLEGEIAFTQSELKKAFERADRNGLLRAAGENIEKLGVKKAWSEAVNEYRPRLCLTRADADALLLLGERLGRTDTDDQIKHIKYIKTLIKGQADAAREEYERLGRLYRSGGLLTGIMLVIILI